LENLQGVRAGLAVVAKAPFEVKHIEGSHRLAPLRGIHRDAYDVADGEGKVRRDHESGGHRAEAVLPGVPCLGPHQKQRGGLNGPLHLVGMVAQKCSSSWPGDREACPRGAGWRGGRGQGQLLNADARAVLDKYFAPDFVHWANGRRSDLQGYAARLASYRESYKDFNIPAWDEAFEAGEKVVVAYTLEASKKAGGVERIPVMAVWSVQGGKVTSLREVEGS
jgi:SnoaL-like domain